MRRTSDLIQHRWARTGEMIQIVGKFYAHSRQIWTKGDPRGEPGLQAVLLGSAMNGGENNSRRNRDRVMRFLLKAAFWLSVVVMLLPAGEKRPDGSVPQV